MHANCSAHLSEIADKWSALTKLDVKKQKLEEVRRGAV